MVSAALCLTGAPLCLPPPCQLQPSFPLLVPAPHPGRKNQGWGNMGSQIPLLTMLGVRSMDNSHGKSLTVSHRFRPGHLAWMRGCGAQDVAVGLVTVTPHHFLQSVHQELGSWYLSPITWKHLDTPGALALNLHKETKHMLLFLHGLKRLLVAFCLSFLQGVRAPIVILEGNNPALAQHQFWSGPWTKPTASANRCLCHQASGNMEYCVAEWYIKTKSTMSLGHPRAL